VAALSFMAVVAMVSVQKNYCAAGKRSGRILGLEHPATKLVYRLIVTLPDPDLGSSKQYPQLLATACR
jgi:hypothetical protein